MPSALHRDAPLPLARPSPVPRTSVADRRARRGAPNLWAPAEIAWLQGNFEQVDASVIRARFARRCFTDVYRMARSLGLAWPDVEPVRDLLGFEPQRLGLGMWSLDELREARVMCRRGVTLHEFKQILARPHRQIRKALLYMGCSPVRPPRWSVEEDAQLAAAFAAGGLAHAIAQTRGRLDNDIHWRLVFLDLVPGKGMLDKTWEHRYLVRAIADHRPMDEIVYSVQAGPKAVVAKALELGCSPWDLADCPKRSH